MNDSAAGFHRSLEQMFHEGRSNALECLQNSLKNKDIFLYGAGGYGKSVKKRLAKSLLFPTAFLDSNAARAHTDFEGCPVLMPDDPQISAERKRNTVVLITFCNLWHETAQVQNRLAALGYDDVRLVSLFPFISWESNDNDAAVEQNADDICRIYENLMDEKSRMIFERQIRAIYHSDPSLFFEQKDVPQYFPKDIPTQFDYRRFMDCGAFTGDTAAELVRQCGIVQAIACFEPCPANYDILVSSLRRNRVAQTQIAIPCGVSDVTRIVGFSEDRYVASGSRIDVGGIERIQAVKIDDVLMDFAPTFVKMDIEGAEEAALRGAEQTIRKWKPALAICVYHRPEDIWNLSRLIATFDGGYRFYLRTHEYIGYETVLYAVHGPRA